MNLLDDGVLERVYRLGISPIFVATITFSVIWLSAVSAQAIAYTVQVIALSDEVRALQLQGELAAQGHPAYLLTVPTPQGRVYRLRVGAFANRAAAAQYAAAMPSVGDSEPTPALAESIPQNLIPLAPELVGRYPLSGVALSLVAWREGLALRAQRSDTLQEADYQEADYRVVGGPSFSAWRASPQDDGTILRVTSLPLWPEDYKAAAQTERDAFAETVLAEVAADLELMPEQVSRFAFDGEPPFLVVAERFNPEIGERTRLRALGQPASVLSTNGPELQWLSDAEAPDLTEVVVLEVGLENKGQAEVVGESWRAVPDGDYTRLESLNEQKTWRAVAGRPLWAGSQVLVTLSGDDAFVYWFVER